MINALCKEGENKMNKSQQLLHLNNQIHSCNKCQLAKTRKNSLPGEGNKNAKLFFIAQAPGETEDYKGKMFIGPSGEVLNYLFNITGIKRDTIYMTNLIKCHLPKNRKPKKEEIQACRHYLDQEITIINPDFLIPLGHYATRYLLQKYDQQIPSKHEFHKLYGTLLYFNQQKIYPLQHPAAALHDNSIQPILEKNYQKLIVFSEPCKWASSCPMKKYEKQGLIGKKWREMYCFGDWENCVRYQMQEQNKFHVDWMLPDGSLDEHLENK